MSRPMTAYAEPSWNDLNDEQATRLLDFRAACTRRGVEWKEKLLGLWATGQDTNQPGGHLLRQIRNRFGPAWLCALED